MGNRWGWGVVFVGLVGCSADPLPGKPTSSADAGGAAEAGTADGGEDASVCAEPNACGGCSALEASVGGSCEGPRGLVGAQWACDGVDALACIEPDVPRDVTASTDDELAVHVRWSAPADGAPTGYVVLRDGSPVSPVVTALSFDDTKASAGSLTAPTEVTASDGTWGGGVRVRWKASSATAGPAGRYTVRAVHCAQESSPSVGAYGQRAAPSLLRYEVEVGGRWMPATTATSFDDTTQPRVSLVSRATAPAVGDVRIGAVRLNAVVEPVLGSPVTYRVRAVSSSPSLTSQAATGRRGAGATVDVRWQRSATDSDADYTDLPDGTGVSWYDSSGPLDGSGRYYRAVLRSEGGDGITTATRTTLTGFTAIAMSNPSTCGIRNTDGALVCWGSTMLVRTEGAPYARLFAGRGRICAFQADAHAPFCLSPLAPLSAPPPPRQFESLDADLGCGLTTAGEAICWGSESSSAPADERFRAAVFAEHGGCGLRKDDGTVRCWGVAWPDVPTEPLLDIAWAWQTGTGCGRRVSDHVPVCWGLSGVKAPAEPLKNLSGDYVRHCGVREADDRMICWQPFADPLAPPSRDRFRDVRVHQDAACGTRLDDDELVCRGELNFWVPPGRSTTLNYGSACTLLEGGRIQCAGAATGSAPLRFPEDHFDRFAFDPGACGVRTDGSLVCYPSHGSGIGPASLGRVRALTSAPAAKCVLRTSDGHSACWGFGREANAAPTFSAEAFTSLSGSQHGIFGVRAADGAAVKVAAALPTTPPPAPPGALTSLVVASTHACGLRAEDHKAICRGDNAHGEAPAGPSDEAFDELVAGYEVTCGLRSEDHRLRCWGERWPTTPSAFAVTSPVISQGMLCAIRETDHAGFCEGALWDELPVTTQLTDPLRSFALAPANEWLTGNQKFCFVKADGHLGCR